MFRTPFWSTQERGRSYVHHPRSAEWLVVPQEAGDGKAKGLRQHADPWALVCKWVTGASVFGLLVLLTILVTEVQEEVEVEGVSHAKQVMRTQFINNHDSHVVDPGVRSSSPRHRVSFCLLPGPPSVDSAVHVGRGADKARCIVTDSAAATVQIHSLLQSVHNLTDSLADGTTHYEWPAPPEPASEPPWSSSHLHTATSCPRFLAAPSHLLRWLCVSQLLVICSTL